MDMIPNFCDAESKSSWDPCLLHPVSRDNGMSCETCFGRAKSPNSLQQPKRLERRRLRQEYIVLTQAAGPQASERALKYLEPLTY